MIRDMFVGRASDTGFNQLVAVNTFRPCLFATNTHVKIYIIYNLDDCWLVRLQNIRFDYCVGISTGHPKMIARPPYSLFVGSLKNNPLFHACQLHIHNNTIPGKD